MKKSQLTINTILRDIIFVIAIIILLILQEKYSIKILYITEEMYNTMINTFVVPLFTGLTTIIVTISVLFYQLYYARFNVKKFLLQILIIFISIFIYISAIILLLFCHYLNLGNEKITNPLLFYLFVGFCAKCILLILLSPKLRIESFVKAAGKQTIQTLNKGKSSYEEITSIFQELSGYYNESIEKKENSFSEAITDIMQNVYSTYLDNSVKICKKLTQEEIVSIEEYLANQLVYNYFKLINADIIDNIQNEYTSFFDNYLDYCIKSDKSTFFEKIFICLRRYYTCNNITEEESVNICKLLFKSYKKSINSENEKFCNVIEEFYLFLLYTDFFFEKESSKYNIFKYFNGILNVIVEHRDFDKYGYILESTTQIIIQNLQEMDLSSLKNLWIFVRNQYDKYNEEQECRIHFEEFLYHITSYSIHIKNELLLNQLGNLYNELLIKDYVTKKLFEQNFEHLIGCLNIIPVSSYYFLPPLSVISKSQYSLYESIELILEQAQQCVFVKNIDMLRMIFDDLKDIKLSKKTTKIILQKLNGLFALIFDEYSYELFDFLFMTFSNFVELIEKQKCFNEENKKIVFQIVLMIMDNIKDIDNSDLHTKVFFQIPKIYSYINELSISERKYVIDQFIYVAIAALETNNLSMLRTCSNQLGWLTKDAIDKENWTLYEYGIMSVKRLYDTAYSFGTDRQFLNFECTIFILLGSLLFLRKETRALNLIYSIIKDLKITDTYNPLVIAKQLRINQFSMFDDFFDDSSDVYTLIDDFYNSIKENI
ncbi:MAG: hypothetical protein MJ211_15950 [Bacteroidales bacterium]|nr:hypothetical protein [Bacteroidales bacterium]